MNIYSIFDDKGKFFSTPFYSRNDNVAVRDFSNVVMNEQNPMSRSKGDYSLYFLGFIFHATNKRHIVSLNKVKTGCCERIEFLHFHMFRLEQILHYFYSNGKNIIIY